MGGIVPWTEQHIGPYNPIFNRAVGRYLRSGNPSNGDLNCIAEFLAMLRVDTRTVPCEIVGATITILQCNHVITLLNNGAFLDDIRPYP